MNQKFYVTTPIYYATARPHLGTLYSTVLADIARRWEEQKGTDTFLLTGTDEHGQKIATAAEKAHKDPKSFVDGFIGNYQDVWTQYGIHYNRFIRTTDRYHVTAIQQWLKQLIEQGDIYKGSYEGWYCVPCETYITESASKDPVCPSCGRETKFISEESYFFKLSAYQGRLLAFYEQHPDIITPRERAAEVISFVKGGLKDLSISRTTISWGIPFPGDEQHVTYVWADALNNYITGVGYGDPHRQDEFNRWWPADLHVLGKDIVRFHAVYWPAFLMASGLSLPKRLLVHGWIKMGDQKMSKSLGNAIDPITLGKTYGPDVVRFYLAKHIAVSHDGHFSTESLEHVATSELANELGNLLNRIGVLAHKYGVHEVPADMIWEAQELALRDQCWTMLDDFEVYMDDNSYHMALSVLWKFINQVNAYFHECEPWRVAKDDLTRFTHIIAATAHSLYAIAHCLWPVMPNKMEQLLDALGCTRDSGVDYLTALKEDGWTHRLLIKQSEPLFIKYEQRKPVSDQTQKKQDHVQSASHITIDDVVKLELHVGTIQVCEPLEGSDKLYRLEVDFGNAIGTRQIVAGVKQYFVPNDLIGKQGVFVTNLKPRKMMGIASQGMMLFAKDSDGQFVITTVDKIVPNGTRLQ